MIFVRVLFKRLPLLPILFPIKRQILLPPQTSRLSSRHFLVKKVGSRPRGVITFGEGGAGHAFETWNTGQNPWEEWKGNGPLSQIPFAVSRRKVVYNRQDEVDVALLSVSPSTA